MPYTLNVAEVINYIVACYKYDAQTPQGWHRCAKTCRSGEKPDLKQMELNV
jgi:hypothetical protein